MPETPYAESNALLAVLRGDDDEVHEILEELMPGERRKLAEAARELASLADDRVSRCAGCTGPVQPGESTISRSMLGGHNQAWHVACLEQR